MRSALKTVIFFTVIWAILPTGCGLGGAYWAYTRHNWKEHAIQVEGCVVKQVEVREKDGILWQPVVEYVFHGKPERYVSGLKSSPKPYKDGAKVNVLIYPDDDSVVRLDRFAELYLCPVVLCAFSIPFVMVALVVVTVCVVLLKKSNVNNEQNIQTTEVDSEDVSTGHL